jgi:hypothetical protein
VTVSKEGQEEHRRIRGDRFGEGAEAYEAPDRQGHVRHEVRAGLHALTIAVP